MDNATQYGLLDRGTPEWAEARRAVLDALDSVPWHLLQCMGETARLTPIHKLRHDFAQGTAVTVVVQADRFRDPAVLGMEIYEAMREPGTTDVMVEYGDKAIALVNVDSLDRAASEVAHELAQAVLAAKEQA